MNNLNRKIKGKKTLFLIITTAFIFGATVVFVKISANSNGEKNYFRGRITYSISIEGKDKDALSFYRTILPASVTVYFDKNRFRMIENGGSLKGNIIALLDQKKFYQIDTTHHIAFRASFFDYDDASENAKRSRPEFFNVLLKDVERCDTLDGMVCRKYELTQSLLPNNTSPKAWLTDSIKLAPSRFDFQVAGKRISSPLPLLLGIKDGAVAKVEMNEKKMRIIWALVDRERINALPDSIFLIPNGYQLR